ncbi:clathrin interactor EPSIN 1 [Rutidosis leptorrhynchoides]|uniref:clathrin interactor EPSIN 1 n=1 Tax=Rutidosis leptorrhynchoides TaxID=125765 RepID=UPI003A98F1DF
MDFMKVFDQTVREIKREVNLKVLKVPEIEQKVLDATDDEPWGPHGSALAEIAHATKKFSECQMVMNVLWTRLTETDRNWRHVYKALAVIEYLVANGSERAVDDIIEHTFQISSLSAFEYVEPNGKDSGINVRKKVENIVALLNDKDKIQAARNKAAANRDKYVGLSSTGITFKSGSGGGSFSKNDRYGGFGGSRDADTFKDSFKDRDQLSEDRFEPGKFKPRRDVTSTTPWSSSKKGSSRYGSTIQDSSAGGASKPSIKNAADKYSSSAPSNNNDDDDFDDFDPRGTSNAKAAAVSSPQVDLFGDSLIGDLLDAPTSGPTQNLNGNSVSEEVDLFADSAFVSAPTNVAGGTSGSEAKVDLFASPPANSAVTPAVDFFAASEQVVVPEIKPTETKTMPSQTVDPFASVPLNNFDNSDFFGSFSSHTDSVSTEPAQSFMDSGSSSNNQSYKTPAAPTPPLKKDGFQVKSGVWADSLSRGLIDLNITGPKKVDLTDVGIVGGLSVGAEEKDKGLPNSLYMGRAMGTGSGLGKSTGFSTSTTAATDMDDFFSSLSGPQNQYGSFQK